VHTPTLEAWLDLEHGEVFDNPYNLYVGGELITEIEIPSTITTIRSYAFSNCINIRSLKISSGLTTIEDYAFDRCQLESVHVSSLETWLNIDCYGDYDHPLRAGATLYINGVTPTEIEIPSTITHIKNAAFYGCKTLKTIKFHENIESIVGDAFYECVNLESVYIPSLEAWLNISFGDPSDVGLNPLDYADKLYVNNELLTELEILSGVTNIDFNQFGGYSGLTKVTLGDSVVSINEEAFAGCSNLESITLSKNITYISFYAFGNCNKLKDVYYDGTIDMWYDSGWGRGTEDIFMDCSQEITVYCTDGEIRI